MSKQNANKTRYEHWLAEIEHYSDVIDLTPLQLVTVLHRLEYVKRFGEWAELDEFIYLYLDTHNNGE